VQGGRERDEVQADDERDPGHARPWGVQRTVEHDQSRCDRAQLPSHHHPKAASERRPARPRLRRRATGAAAQRQQDRDEDGERDALQQRADGRRQRAGVREHEDHTEDGADQRT